MFTKIFEELGLSLLTQRVFSDLIEKGASTARQLAERLDIPRTSVYDHIKILIANGLVTEKNLENKKVFAIDNISRVQDLVQEKIESLEAEKKEFEKSLPLLLEKTNFIEPQIKFYSGKEGMKQVMNHIMQNRNIETLLMWPMSEMMKVFGSKYLEEVNIKRIRRSISLKAIWPRDKKLESKDYPFLGVGEKHLRELRFAPDAMTWNMGYWMYDDKVAFLSSEKEGFGFVVHSRDFANLIKIQFEAIWKISEPVKSEPQKDDAFLKKIGMEN